MFFLLLLFYLSLSSLNDQLKSTLAIVVHVQKLLSFNSCFCCFYSHMPLKAYLISLNDRSVHSYAILF